MQHVTAKWVTFPDPDDMLEPEYFSSVAAMMARFPETQMFATSRILFEETGHRFGSAATVEEASPVQAVEALEAATEAPPKRRRSSSKG